MSVVMVERDKVGGTCLHRGCIPTKALLHAAEVADNAKEGPEKFGVKSTFDGIDMAGRQCLQGRRRQQALQGPFRPGEVPQHRGRAKARAGSPAPTSLQVGDRHIEARHSSWRPVRTRSRCPADDRRRAGHHQRPRAEPGPRPESVIVLGAGAIGCEFASVWNSFGATVTIVEALPHLVPAEEESSSKLLERAFRRKGIAFPRRHQADRRRHLGHGRHASPSRTARRSRPSCCWSPSVAARSRPDLGYEEAGVEIDRGFVKVDATCQTNVPTISAIGDLRPGLQLAHVGFGEGILVAEQLAGLRVVRSTTTASRGSPTPTPRSHRSGSPRRSQAAWLRRRHRHLRPGRQRPGPDPADRRRRAP